MGTNQIEESSLQGRFQGIHFRKFQKMWSAEKAGQSSENCVQNEGQEEQAGRVYCHLLASFCHLQSWWSKNRHSPDIPNRHQMRQTGIPAKQKDFRRFPDSVQQRAKSRGTKGAHAT